MQTVSKTKEARRLSKLKRESESHESRNIAKRYKLPEAAVNIIREAGSVHGQQSRAIQVAVEFLFNTPGYGVADAAMSAILDSPLTGKTYKLPGRTVSLVEGLKHEYGTHGNVLSAVAYMLSKPRLRDGVTPMPIPAGEKIVSYEPVPPLEKGETMVQRVKREAAEFSQERAARRRHKS